MNTVKKIKSESTELPDCIISYIFSKVSLKNLVKTSALSKQWYLEWGLRKDLNFDLHNMFDYNPITDLPIAFPLFQQLQSQFAASLDNFMQKYPGDMISSIRVNFPLCVDHTYALDGLIHKGVLKGANRIELLLPYTYKTDKSDLKIRPYLFPSLSGPNSLTYLRLRNCHIATMEFSWLKNLRTLVLTHVPLKQNSLPDMCFNCIRLENFTLNQCRFLSDIKITSPTLLHLKIYCGGRFWTRNLDIIASNLLSLEYSSKFYTHIYPKVNINSPMLSKLTYTCGKIFNLEFSRLTNVRKIMLNGLSEDGDVITRLFSTCLQLEDVSINMCRFDTRVFKIIGEKLRRLSIAHCYHRKYRNCYHRKYSPCKLEIHALNLTSFEYRGNKQIRSIISIEAPKLLKVFWDAGFNKINIYNFATIASLHHPENLTMHMSLSQVSKLMKEYMDQYQNLIQLKLYIGGAYDPNMDCFWILDNAMASQHLQKLSLTMSYSTF